MLAAASASSTFFPVAAAVASAGGAPSFLSKLRRLHTFICFLFSASCFDVGAFGCAWRGYRLSSEIQAPKSPESEEPPCKSCKGEW